MSKKKKYGNPLKEQARREEAKNKKLNNLYDYLSSYMTRLNKGNKALMLAEKMVGSKQDMFNNMHVDLGVALNSNEVKLTDLLSENAFEITAAVPQDNGNFNIVSAILNKHEVYFWMPNIKREDVESAAEFVKTHVQKYCIEKYNTAYFVA